MTHVGFKRATIAIFDGSGAVSRSHVFEGKEDEGGTSTAEITGLSKEALRAYASDLAYYVSQRGTGDVSVALSLLDAPESFTNEMLGYNTTSDKLAFLGEKSQAPYCSLLLESSNLQGETALLGFFKGRFSKDGETLNTLTNEAFTPEPEAFTFNAVSETKEGEANGQVMVKYSGNDEEAITKLKKLVIPETSSPVA